jgi:ribosomal protein L21E
MPAGHGLRSRTRDTFSRGFRQKGYINLTTYLRSFRLGDYVDIKVNGAVHKVSLAVDRQQCTSVGVQRRTLHLRLLQAWAVSGGSGSGQWQWQQSGTSGGGFCQLVLAAPGIVSCTISSVFVT